MVALIRQVLVAHLTAAEGDDVPEGSAHAVGHVVAGNDADAGAVALRPQPVNEVVSAPAPFVQLPAAERSGQRSDPTRAGWATGRVQLGWRSERYGDVA